jgi:hypothetical protein
MDNCLVCGNPAEVAGGRDGSLALCARCASGFPAPGGRSSELGQLIGRGIAHRARREHPRVAFTEHAADEVREALARLERAVWFAVLSEAAERGGREPSR